MGSIGEAPERRIKMYNALSGQRLVILMTRSGTVALESRSKQAEEKTGKHIGA